MPRFRDTSLQNSKPSVARKDRIKTQNIKRTIDPAILEMLDVAQERAYFRTTFDPLAAQQPQCQFGYSGICCRICFQGPCRIKAEEGPAAWASAAPGTTRSSPAMPSG